MQLQIVKKFSPFRLAVDVTDGNGNQRYKIRGRFLSPTHVTTVYNSSGEKTYKVRRQLFHVPFTRTTILYDASGAKIAKMRQKFALANGFTMDCYGDRIRLSGDILGWNFSVYKNDALIGSVQAEFSMFGKYVAQLANSDDADLFMSLFVAVLNLKHKK